LEPRSFKRNDTFGRPTEKFGGVVGAALERTFHQRNDDSADAWVADSIQTHHEHKRP
jgi:hypothetical protein